LGVIQKAVLGSGHRMSADEESALIGTIQGTPPFLVRTRIKSGPWIQEIDDEVIAAAMAVEDHDVSGTSREGAVNGGIEVRHQVLATLAVTLAGAFNHIHRIDP